MLIFLCYHAKWVPDVFVPGCVEGMLLTSSLSILVCPPGLHDHCLLMSLSFVDVYDH